MSMDHHKNPRNNTSLRRQAGHVIRRAFPAFHFGWMLFYSLFFGAIVFLAMRVLDIISSALIKAAGYPALTSSNFMSFLRSWKGYAVAFLLLIALCAVAGIILNGITLLSDDMLHQRKIRLPRLIQRSIFSIRLFLCKEAVPIVLYYLVFVLFFTVSLLAIVPNPFEIPGYIRYLISKRLWAMALYFLLFLLICIPILRNPLLLHDILIRQERPGAAVRRTRAYVKKHRRFLFQELLLSVLVFCACLLIAAGIFLYVPKLVQFLCGPLPAPLGRILVLLATYLGMIYLILTVLLSLWILPVKISFLYHHVAAGAFPLPQKRKRNHWLWLCLPVCVAMLAGITWYSFVHFNYLYPPARQIEAVVHRLGGDLDTENTLEGMEKAIALGAPAMETDIQRTKDGEYVIFHDSTLKRMCGIPSRINSLTLEEVRSLRLPGPEFEERRIPLLSEVLDLAKGRVRLYLELKGTDADARMARDVFRMLKDRDMEDDCVLISLNYNLISYIARNIPGIQCGYLYFFAYGAPAKLAGNMLMSQSNAINQSRTRAIHSKGKKVYCWTVNSRQTALNMVRQRVDGIITDRYDIVESVLDHMESRNDYERIMDVLLR